MIFDNAANLGKKRSAQSILLDAATKKRKFAHPSVYIINAR